MAAWVAKSRTPDVSGVFLALGFRQDNVRHRTP
jgi:hypothetical protein